jgi:hypothetical protein
MENQDDPRRRSKKVCTSGLGCLKMPFRGHG